MKILFIVPYPTDGSSNRFRVEQYLPHLKKEDINYSVRPFCNRYLYRILYKKGFFFRKIFFFIIFTFRRISDIVIACSCDIIFIHREAFPFGTFMESIFSKWKKKIIYDFDDALFLPNVSDSNQLIKIFKNTSKTKKIIGMSDYVIAGNDFLKAYALKFNSNVSVIPTPIDTDKYRPLSGRNPDANVTIGWIGSTTTVRYLDILINVFNIIFKKYNYVNLVIVGGRWNTLTDRKILCKEWSLETEVNDLQSFDIGIMPLADDDWSKGKCAFKIIEYMAVGIPVVASAVGMNTEVIQNGVNGFLANTDKEWMEKFSLLIENPGLRKTMGDAGRRTVEEKYSLKLWAPRFLEVINKAR